MLVFIAVALGCGTFLLTLYLARPFVDRAIRVFERRTDLAERTVAKADKRDPIPMDLLHSALQWSDEWARNQHVRALMERYEELGDWNRVRAVVTGASAQENNGELS